MQLNQLRTVLRISTLSLVAIASSAEAAEINLSCQGQIEYKTDNRVEQKPLNVDLLLDTADNRVRFSDMWGCVIDMGSTSANSDACSASLPVSVKENEVSFYKEQTNERYATKTSFALSRYSGRLSVRSAVIALPASQATWSLFMLSADLSCSPLSKKF